MTKPKHNVFDIKLDPEEQELLDSIERGEWVSVENLEEKKAEAKEMAFNTLNRNVLVDVAILTADLDRIKQIAAYEGISYQALMASVLHKFSAGHL